MLNKISPLQWLTSVGVVVSVLLMHSFTYFSDVTSVSRMEEKKWGEGVKLIFQTDANIAHGELGSQLAGKNGHHAPDRDGECVQHHLISEPNSRGPRAISGSIYTPLVR